VLLILNVNADGDTSESWERKNCQSVTCFSSLQNVQSHARMCNKFRSRLTVVAQLWTFAWYTEDCRQTKAGHDYLGMIHVTKSGKQCQKWSLDSPHEVKSSYTDDKFPDRSREAANNYCRNPDSSWTGLWCYTTDPDTNWEECDIPLCSKSAAVCTCTCNVLCVWLRPTWLIPRRSRWNIRHRPLVEMGLEQNPNRTNRTRTLIFERTEQN